MNKSYMKLIAILAIAIVATGCGKKDDTDNIVVPPNMSYVESNQDYADMNGDVSVEPEDTSDISEPIIDNEEYQEYVENLEGFYIDNDGYLVKEEPKTVVDDFGNEYTQTSVLDDFKGIPLDGYIIEDKQDNSKTLISGSDYNESVDIDIDKIDWVTVYEDMVNNPDSYRGKTIRIRGTHYCNDDNHIVYISDNGCELGFLADTYPTNGISVEIVGTIYQNSDTKDFWVDTESVYRLG